MRKIDNVNNVNTKFIIAMDNYFTRSKVIVALRDLGIGIVSTAKYQHGDMKCNKYYTTVYIYLYISPSIYIFIYIYIYIYAISFLYILYF